MRREHPLLLPTDETRRSRPRGARPLAPRPARNRMAPALVPHPMESGCWLVTLPAIDGRQYVYRVYAPENARPADLFWEAWHCHDEKRLPRA